MFRRIQVSVSHFLLVLGLLAGAASLVLADETTLPPALCGNDEREDGVGTCPVEAAFKAGVPSADLHLKIGGETWGCDSEWASSFEFDLSSLPAGAEVYVATLVVRKTGYSDDSQGFTYLGAYAYDPTGAEVPVAREDLTPETALAIAYPSAANTDLSFDVTAAVQAWAATGAARAGLLLAPVYPEIGYEDWISVGGCGYAVPPRLIVVYQGVVRSAPASWSDLKASFR